MSKYKYMVGVITKDRYDGLKVLLKSLQNIDNVKVIDASEHSEIESIRKQFPNVQDFYYNIPRSFCQVVHTKNILIHQFLKGDYDYLFLIEDDVKILDDDIFDKYIEISNKYNIPHMNFCSHPSEQETLYLINDDVQISERLLGVFSFYSRRCIQRVGMMNPALNNNCWEHVEHTARIHKEFNYQPSFNHFPDIVNSWEYIKMQRLPSVIGNKPIDILNNDKRIMLNSLGWVNYPLVSIKRFDINNINY